MVQCAGSGRSVTFARVIGSIAEKVPLQAQRRFRPDVLLGDVLMPQMNGVEFAIAMRKMYPLVKISEILLDGQRQGFEFELIAKPNSSPEAY
jgi:CheY-like chemotaxis protein